MRRLLCLLALVVCALVLACCAAPTEPPPFPTSPPPTKTDTPLPPTSTPYPVTLEPGKEPLVLAAVSMNAVMDTEKNRETLALYMEQARATGAHLVAFPSNALQQNPAWGYEAHEPKDEALAYLREAAEMVPGPSTNWLVQKASEIGIYCVFGMAEVGEDGNLYNSAVFLGPDGVIGVHRNQRFDANMNTDQLFAAGPESLEIYDSPLGRVGIAIGTEMAEDHSSRLSVADADFLVSITSWPTRFRAFLFSMAGGHGARAHLWQAVANTYGDVGEVKTFGQSMILDPGGWAASSIGSEEGMAIAQTSVLVDSSLFGSE